MPTQVNIDTRLLREAMRATGLKTEREVIEEGLRTLLRLKAQQEIRTLRGKLTWTGNLDDLRTDH
jgi:Arc/MetJ family transcription regulator